MQRFVLISGIVLVLVGLLWPWLSRIGLGRLPGDIVIEVDGQSVSTEYDIYRIIFNHSVGETLRFAAVRNENERIEFELLLQEFPRQP